MVGLGSAFCRHEERAIFPMVTAVGRVASRDGRHPFLGGSKVSAHHHQSRPPVMVVEGRTEGDIVLDHYPGFNLSIPELCHALKTKLAQTRDSRYAHRRVWPLFSQ